MNIADYDAWLAYLEAPKNQRLQCRKALQIQTKKRKPCNCCLGVAANVCNTPKHASVPKYKDSHRAVATGRPVITRFAYTFSDADDDKVEDMFTPPHGWQGLSQVYIGLLVILNDELLLSFREIAAAIRESSAHCYTDGSVTFDSSALTAIVDFRKTLRDQRASGIYSKKKKSA